LTNHQFAKLELNNPRTARRLPSAISGRNMRFDRA
jgi:hypothetical protein